MNDTRRRDFLKVAGGVAVVGTLAGCAGEAQEEEEEPEDPAEGDEGMDEPTEEEPPEEEPEDEEDEVEGDDLIRVAHMIPDFPDVDVYVDDSEEPVFEGVSYTNATEYTELPEGEYQIRVTVSDARSLVVFNEQVEVPAGNTTAVALGEPEEDEPANGEGEEGGAEIGFQLELFEDDNTPPSESINDSRLRLIHASPDAPAVDVSVGRTTVFENISFGEGEYFDLPAGDYEFEVFPADGEGQEEGDEGQEPEGEGQEEEDENGMFSTLAATDGGSEISVLQADEDEPAPGEEEQEEGEGLPEDDGPAEDEPGAEDEGPADEEEPAPGEDEEAPEDEPVFTFSASTEEDSVSTAFAVGYLDPEAVDSDEEFDVVLTEDVVDGEVVQQEDEDDD